MHLLLLILSCLCCVQSFAHGPASQCSSFLGKDSFIRQKAISDAGKAGFLKALVSNQILDSGIYVVEGNPSVQWVSLNRTPHTVSIRSSSEVQSKRRRTNFKWSLVKSQEVASISLKDFDKVRVTIDYTSEPFRAVGMTVAKLDEHQSVSLQLSFTEPLKMSEFSIPGSSADSWSTAMFRHSIGRISIEVEGKDARLLRLKRHIGFRTPTLSLSSPY